MGASKGFYWPVGALLVLSLLAISARARVSPSSLLLIDLIEMACMVEVATMALNLSWFLTVASPTPPITLLRLLMISVAALMLTPYPTMLSFVSLSTVPVEVLLSFQHFLKESLCFVSHWFEGCSRLLTSLILRRFVKKFNRSISWV